MYAASKIAEARLTELREERARIALLESIRDPRARMGARIGAALIRLGQWLGAGEPSTGRSARTGGDWSARAA